MRAKPIVSSLLLITFLVVLLTGIALWISPRGVGKHTITQVHTIIGFLMSALIIAHFWLNYRIFIGEIRNIKQ
ncbi:MAG: DUF4405 domain-containing protein [Candidatus Diapherotrites archaeon]|nr:DUF4405 domain-containing protein [Candidatus Diapherotrites archaeon]